MKTLFILLFILGFVVFIIFLAYILDKIFLEDKFSKRLKRALAAFLRDELLEFIGYNERTGLSSEKIDYKIIEQPLELITVQETMELNVGGVEYEKRLQRMRDEISRAVLAYAKVDSTPLVNFEDMYKRKISLSVLVASPK